MDKHHGSNQKISSWSWSWSWAREWWTSPSQQRPKCIRVKMFSRWNFVPFSGKLVGKICPKKKLFTDLRINGLFVGDWWGGWVASRASSKCRRILKNIEDCRLITATLWGAKDKYGNDHTWIIYTTLHLHCGGGLNIHFITFTSGGRSTLRWRNLSSVVRASSWYPAAFARRADDDWDDSFHLWWYWC